MGKASHDRTSPPSGAVPGVVEAAPPAVARGDVPRIARRPNVVVLALVTTTAAAIGLLPWLDITERGPAAALLVGVWLLVSVARARVLAAAPDAHPRAWELAAGVVSSLFPASLVSAVALLVYGVGLLVGVLLRVAGVDADTSRGETAEVIAFACSCVAAFAFCAPCAILATDTTSQQLYPQTAGLRGAYGLLAQRQRRRRVAAYGLPAALAGAATLLLPGLGLVILTQVLVLLWSATIFSLGRDDRSAEDRRTTMSLVDAFAAEDYNVVEAPRTGDPAVDPLLMGVDLLAYDRTRAFAVRLKPGPGAAAPNPLADAASLELAATTLADVAWQLDVQAGHVEPVLVLTGEKAGDALIRFCEREHIHLVVFPEPGEPPSEQLATAVTRLKDVETA